MAPIARLVSGLALVGALLGCSDGHLSARGRASNARSVDDLQLRRFLADYAKASDGAELTYRHGYADLNGDGAQEAIVWLNSPGQCGSGGCDTLVLTPGRNRYVLVSKTSITWPPIQVMPTSTNGWRDLSVYVSGGGIIPGYHALLRFDGERYPNNPTVPPAEAARAAANHPKAEVVIVPLR